MLNNVKVELTKKIKAVLQDPEAREDLRYALAEDGQTDITVGKNRYKLVPLPLAEAPMTPGTSNTAQP